MRKSIVILALLIAATFGCVAMTPKGEVTAPSVKEAARQLAEESASVAVGPVPSPVFAAGNGAQDGLCSQGEFPEFPADSGEDGVKSQFAFVTQGATREELGIFLRKVDEAGFGLAMMTVNINGRDTLFVSGARALMDENQLQREYLVACTLRVGEHIYLAHARYNKASEQSEYRRVM